MTVSTKPRTTTSGATKTDAIHLLTADHKKVKKLFSEFEKIKQKGSAKEKEALVLEICAELMVHAQLEEEIFYPAVREAIDDDIMMDEALVEHSGAKELIAQLMADEPSAPLFDAKVTVLGEEIDHHAAEEEEEMFVRARKADLDLDALGEEMLARKKVLAKALPK